MMLGSPSPAASQRSASQTPSGRKWQCAACTLENDAALTECGACGTQKSSNLTYLTSTRRTSPGPKPLDTPASNSAGGRNYLRSLDTPVSPNTPANKGLLSAASTPSATGTDGGEMSIEQRVDALERALRRRTETLASRLEKVEQISEQRFVYLKESHAASEHFLERAKDRDAKLEQNFQRLNEQFVVLAKTPEEKVGDMSFEILQQRITTLTRNTEVRIHEMMRLQMEDLQTKLEDTLHTELVGKVQRALSARTLQVAAVTHAEKSAAQAATPDAMALTNGDIWQLNRGALSGGSQEKTAAFSPQKGPGMRSNGWRAGDNEWQLQKEHHSHDEGNGLEVMILQHEVQEWVGKQKKFEARLSVVEAKQVVHGKSESTSAKKMCC